MLDYSTALAALSVLAGSTGPIDMGSAVAPFGMSQETVRFTTIGEIHADPKMFAGKRVRLAGQLNECFLWECSLCPATMTMQTRDANQCLALEFGGLIEGTGHGSPEQEAVFRFADVVLEATFNPSCWQVPCTDRAAVLYDARVIQVREPRPSRSGLWLGTTSELAELEGSEAGDLIKAAHEAGYPTGTLVKAFRVIDDPAGLLVCWSGFGTGSWPSTLEGALYARSTRDFYRCNSVRQVNGRYILQVDS